MELVDLCLVFCHLCVQTFSNLFFITAILVSTSCVCSMYISIYSKYKCITFYYIYINIINHFLYIIKQSQISLFSVLPELPNFILICLMDISNIILIFIFFRYLFSFVQRYISSSREILNPHISSLTPHPSSLPWATLSPVWSLENPQSTKCSVTKVTPTSIRDLLALWPFLQAPSDSCWGFHE